MQIGYTPDDVLLLASIRDHILAHPDAYRDGEAFLRSHYGPDRLNRNAWTQWDASLHWANAARYAWQCTWPDDEPDERDRIEREFFWGRCAPPKREQWTSGACAVEALKGLRKLGTHNDVRFQAIMILAVLLWDEGADKQHPIFTVFGAWGTTPAGEVESPARWWAASLLHEEAALRGWMDTVKAEWGAPTRLAEAGQAGAGGTDEAAKKIRPGGDKLDETGEVRSPADPSAYVPAKDILAKHNDPQVVASHKELAEKILPEHPEIKRWHPRCNRLMIHLADWLTFVGCQSHASEADDNPSEIEARKAEAHRRKAGE